MPRCQKHRVRKFELNYAISEELRVEGFYEDLAENCFIEDDHDAAHSNPEYRVEYRVWFHAAILTTFLVLPNLT